jgi:hypothetical protein
MVSLPQTDNGGHQETQTANAYMQQGVLRCRVFRSVVVQELCPVPIAGVLYPESIPAKESLGLSRYDEASNVVASPSMWSVTNMFDRLAKRSNSTLLTLQLVH